MQTENKYEQAFWDKGYTYVVGLDEAGRGPIAGPLVVAAVIFPQGYAHPYIYDSKKLSEKKREMLFDEITEDAIEFHILVVDVQTIDKQNIYRATQNAMHSLVMSCIHKDAVLSDAMPLPDLPLPLTSLIKGDQKSVSIAAASILAKVTRDRIMIEYDKQYPQYGFAQHKGYPTKQHKEALQTHGVLSIHRKSYAPVINALK
ncbi:MAG: ribonuclease HII [Breznakia sp.]